MANGDFLLGAIPTPIKILVFLVGGLGFPIFVAGFYMLQNTGWIPSNDRIQIQIMSKLVDNDNIIVANQRDIIKLLIDHGHAQAIALRILCENSALERKDLVGANNCKGIIAP